MIQHVSHDRVEFETSSYSALASWDRTISKMQVSSGSNKPLNLEECEPAGPCEPGMIGSPWRLVRPAPIQQSGIARFTEIGAQPEAWTATDP